jgi:hypothetical protein
MVDPVRDALSSLLRPRKLNNTRADPALFSSSNPNTPSPGPATRRQPAPRHATADFTEADDDEDDESQVDAAEEEEDAPQPSRAARKSQGHGAYNEEGRRSSGIMFPLFSATHLGKPLTFEGGNGFAMRRAMTD